MEKRGLDFLNHSCARELLKKLDDLKKEDNQDFERNVIDYLKNSLSITIPFIPIADLNFFVGLYSEQVSSLEKIFEKKRNNDLRERDKQSLLFQMITKAQDKSLREKMKLTLHGERVGLYSESLALDFDMDAKLARLSGRYHDLGKLIIPSDILLKRNNLTEKDWQYIFEHPLWSEKILGSFYGDKRLLDSVRHHHENWSGSGYPDGIEGNEISVYSRILRIADSFDSMTFERPYRKEKNFDEAIAELSENSKGDYDPKIVKRVGTLRKIHNFFHQVA